MRDTGGERRAALAIITIARELAALGEEVAAAFSRRTGYRLVDRAQIERRLDEAGVDTESRRRYDERKPGFWASLSRNRDAYLHYLKGAILEEAGAGPCVIVGRGAAVVLRGLPNLVSVRVGAPLAVRVERVRAEQDCDERRALQIVEHSDHDRSGFQKYFFACDWREPSEYHLTVNTAAIEPLDAAAIIDRFRELTISEARERRGDVVLADLRLAHRVVTEILYVRGARVHLLEAETSGGRVILRGVVSARGELDAAVAAARAVPGVELVECAIQVVTSNNVVP